jgi:hypothetical protein
MEEVARFFLIASILPLVLGAYAFFVMFQKKVPGKSRFSPKGVGRHASIDCYRFVLCVLDSDFQVFRTRSSDEQPRTALLKTVSSRCEFGRDSAKIRAAVIFGNEDSMFTSAIYVDRYRVESLVVFPNESRLVVQFRCY